MVWFGLGCFCISSDNVKKIYTFVTTKTKKKRKKQQIRINERPFFERAKQRRRNYEERSGENEDMNEEKWIMCVGEYRIEMCWCLSIIIRSMLCENSEKEKQKKRSITVVWKSSM